MLRGSNRHGSQALHGRQIPFTGAFPEPVNRKEYKGNMSDYIISCCSTADLSREHFEKRDLHFICFHFSLNQNQYLDDLGRSMPFAEFYQAMRDGADTSTSQVNEEEFIVYFEPFLQQGKDILHVTLSSGISGVYNSANLAKRFLSEKYPERKIYIVDSLAASSGYGLLMDALCDLRDAGKSLDEVRDWAEQNKRRLNHWFFTTDLTFFVKGGRVSKTKGFIGNALHICPLLNVDADGHLAPQENIRTKKKTIARLVEQMTLHARDGLDYDGKCYISQSDCIEDAQKVAQLVEATFRKLDGPVLINNIGTTIGSHTGPGTVALFFWGKERT